MFDFQKKVTSCLVKVFNLNKKHIRVRKLIQGKKIQKH